MTSDFIKLKCPNCAGKLDVYHDMEQFTCGYCGMEMIARRRGGTVALKLIESAIGKVQVGTDKTAAELAIVRHHREMEDLSAQVAEAEKQRSGKVGGLGCLLAVVVIVGFLLIGSGHIFWSLVACVGAIALVTAWFRVDKRHRGWLAQVAEAESDLQRKIMEKRELADA